MANTEYLPGFVLASSDLSFAYACFPPGACPFETPRMVIHSHCIAVVSGMQFKIVHWGRVKQKISQQPSIVEQFLILLSSEFGIKRIPTDGETIFFSFRIKSIELPFPGARRAVDIVRVACEAAGTGCRPRGLAGTRWRRGVGGEAPRDP